MTGRSRRRPFTPAALARLREQPIEEILARLAIDLKVDSTFVPVKDVSSRRWHVHAAGGDFEILTTGPKWYDTRAAKGGGGAIDLTMHLLGVSFVEAVRFLTAKATIHGTDRP